MKSLLFSLVLAFFCGAAWQTASAADLCAPSYAQADASEAALQQADALFGKNEAASARAAFDVAMTHLQAAPWKPDARGCDDAHFALNRFTVAMHSLATSLRFADAVQVADTREHMWTQFFDVGHAPINYFVMHDGAMWKQMEAYSSAIVSAADAENILIHKTSAPGCAHPNLPAVVRSADVSNLMGGALTLPSGDLEVHIDVSLAADGSVLDAKVSHPSGSPAFDLAALAGAKKSTYLPAIQNCVAVPSRYDSKSQISTTRTPL